ncbi:hypothetical protein EDB83DRAFT_2318747 [Lactarius deliciosus]|nr:hypothetical protein EDB83DRAFT_2318747 [Lactarius deliciosus]
MPVKKPAKHSCLQNVQKALVKRIQNTKKSSQAAVDGTHLPSEGLEVTMLNRDERESSPDIMELSAVELFSSVLQNAQRQAAAVEGPRKCTHPSRHNGKSERTIRRRKKLKRDLEEQGFLLLPEFFKQKAKCASAMQQGGVEAVQHLEEEEEEPEDNEQDEQEEEEDNKTTSSLWVSLGAFANNPI